MLWSFFLVPGAYPANYIYKVLWIRAVTICCPAITKPEKKLKWYEIQHSPAPAVLVKNAIKWNGKLLIVTNMRLLPEVFELLNRIE